MGGTKGLTERELLLLDLVTTVQNKSFHSECWTGRDCNHGTDALNDKHIVNLLRKLKKQGLTRDDLEKAYPLLRIEGPNA